VAVQLSGTFGSRQEEAQRLGRVTRPKHDGRQAHFYTVVSRDTVDTDYAAHRQRFLAEQGYAYRIVDADDLLGPALPDPDSLSALDSARTVPESGVALDSASPDPDAPADAED
jgi:superfamily II DNA or RNA helicase